MTPADLDAIVARAASVFPEDAGWDGDEAERALTTVTQHVPAIADALREAWQERDSINDARNVLTDAVVEITRERDEWKHVAEQRDVDGAALASRLRADKAEQRQRAERAEHERDAALAAVDAVRADYAPRREPPTADEVRAVSRLWGASNAPVLLQIPRGFVTANVSTGVRGSIVGWTEPDVRRVAAAESWLFLGPNGPVAWSELAALVRGGDRG